MAPSESITSHRLVDLMRRFLYYISLDNCATLFAIIKRSLNEMNRVAATHLRGGIPLLAGLFVLILSGCSPKIPDTIVARVGDTPITVADFERMYVKSNGTREAGVSASQEDRERFLDLIIKYRLKLADAYDQGLQKRPDVNTEIEQYKGSLAQSYLTDRQLVQPNVTKMYNRMKEELRASHILLTFKQGATVEDSAAVYKQANEIIAEVKSGKDFGQLAETYSQDPSAKTNKGDLYYFSTGRMVPEFEDGVFALQKGEVTPVPIKTQYGIHIVKVTDRKPSAGEMRCSHIMIRFNSQTPSPEDTLAAYQRIKAIRDSLAGGNEFADLAIRNSGDPGSASRGGDLGWFSRGRWPQPFDEEAFLLKPGQVSGIVRTIYGYHLIKCTEARPLKSFEELRQELQRTYQQQRFQGDYAAMYNRIQQEVRFTQNDSVRQQFLASLDSTKTVRDSAWADAIPREIGRAAMVTIAGKPVPVDTMASIFARRPDLASTSLHRVSMSSALDKIIEQLVYTAKAGLLEASDPEFASILNEYREGILLYQIEQDQVWSKIATSDSLQRIYFEQNRDKFVFPDRIVFTEIRAASESNAWNIHNLLKQGESMEAIAHRDSVRMAAPSSFTMRFAPKRSEIPTQEIPKLASIAQELRNDPVLNLQVVAYPDTGSAKTKRKNLALAQKRIDSVRQFFSKRLSVDIEHIISQSRPRNFVPAVPRQADTTDYPDRLDLTILRRQPLVLPPVQTITLAPGTDERVNHADSLRVGEFSSPFQHQAAFLIVRLDKRDPAHRKSYEEAGTEVSSAFQDYEAKRLESEWLGRVRAQHPVSENKPSLQKAFTLSE